MIAEMRKLILIGNRSEAQATLDLLNGAGCVEVVPARALDGAAHADFDKESDAYALRLADLEFAMELIASAKREAVRLADKKIINYTPVKRKFLAPVPTLTYEEFQACTDKIPQTDDVINKLKKLSDALTEAAADEVRCNNVISSMLPYAEIPVKLSDIRSTANTYAVAGTVSSTNFRMEGVLADKAICFTYGNGAQKAVVVICHKDDADDVSSALSDMEFAACSLTLQNTVAEEIAAQKNALADIAQRRAQIISDIVKFESSLQDIRLMHDYYSVQHAKVAGKKDTVCTSSSYVLEGWVPLSCTEQVNSLLEKSDYSLSYYFLEPEEGDDVPTLAVNNSVATPYETVTNMFSSPKYREIDPNPFVAIFFFLFFGMMLADVGYGVLLTLATAVYLAVVRPPRGRGNMIKLLFMGGISTVIWGALFGSYFGVSASTLGIWYWFNPIDDPITMLFLSLGVGLVQMLFGFLINMVALFRQKKPLDAIFGNLCWYLMLFGGAGAFLGGKIASWVPYLGYAVLGTGVLFLMLSGMIHSKGVKRIGSGLGKLYDIVNFFSDLMSYTRLFGLGLASAVIAMVFNQIGVVIKDMMPSAPVLGWAIACVIFLIGHTFNLGINTLGAYVHDSRLQFVEFFGKFYEGGGRLFSPLGSQMKYYYIDNNKYNSKNKIGGKK